MVTDLSVVEQFCTNYMIIFKSSVRKYIFTEM